MARLGRFGALAAPRWFQAHLLLHLAAACLFIFGISVALINFQVESPSHYSHAELGRAVLVLWCVQAGPSLSIHTTFKLKKLVCFFFFFSPFATTSEENTYCHLALSLKRVPVLYDQTVTNTS